MLCKGPANKNVRLPGATTCRDDEEPWRMAQVAPSRRVDSPWPRRCLGAIRCTSGHRGPVAWRPRARSAARHAAVDSIAEIARAGVNRVCVWSSLLRSEIPKSASTAWPSETTRLSGLKSRTGSRGSLQTPQRLTVSSGFGSCTLNRRENARHTTRSGERIWRLARTHRSRARSPQLRSRRG